MIEIYAPCQALLAAVFTVLAVVWLVWQFCHGAKSWFPRK